MNNTLLAFLSLSVIVLAIVFVFVLVELRMAIKALREFINNTDCSLKPTLEELQLTLKGLRNITDNVTIVTEDVKELSGSVRDVGRNVRRVSDVIDGFSALTVARASGLRAGISAAAEVLLKNLFNRCR